MLLSLFQSSKSTYSWVYNASYISLLSATASVDIDERLYSADTRYELDPHTNVFIV